jgi:organic hydroperoxide reductase OsmC/OhrA
MIQYPLYFQVESKAQRGIHSQWATLTPGNPEAACAIPPEFEGPGGGYSPEDFFAMAMANCFVATFKVIAEKSKVEFESLRIAGRLTVDRNEKGQPWMAAIHLIVEVQPGATDPARIQRTLEKTSQSCIVAHSLKTPVSFEFKIA